MAGNQWANVVVTPYNTYSYLLSVLTYLHMYLLPMYLAMYVQVCT